MQPVTAAFRPEGGYILEESRAHYRHRVPLPPEVRLEPLHLSAQMHVCGIKTHAHTGGDHPNAADFQKKKACLSFDLLFDALLFQSGNDSLALLKTSPSSLLCCSLTRASHQYSCLFCDDGKGASRSNNLNHWNVNRKNLT